MPDSSEIAALKASFRGALAAAESLSALRDRVDSLGAIPDMAVADLEDLARLSAANALAASALRGLVETLKKKPTGV
jgi:cell division GTPase FtsZ